MAGKKSLSPPLPWKTKISVALFDVVMNFSYRSNDTINRRLLKLLIPTTRAPSKPVKGVKISDITVDATRNLWCRLFVPTKLSSTTKLPVLVFFHGGSFSFLSPDTSGYHSLCRRLASMIPAIVVSVNYRLSPEHRFPAPYDDGFDVLKFLDKQGFDGFPGNADLSQCFIAGDSAGGNIAHHVTRRAMEFESEFTRLKVIGLIAMQPFFGGEERTESETLLDGAPLILLKRTDWHWKVFLPEGANRDHVAANVPSSVSDLKSFPPTLLCMGGFDPLRDRQKQYYEGLKGSGKIAEVVDYPNAIHAFYVFQELPEARLFLAEVVKFLHGISDIKKETNMHTDKKDTHTQL